MAVCDERGGRGVVDSESDYLADRDARRVEVALRDNAAVDQLALLVDQDKQDVLLLLEPDKPVSDEAGDVIIVDDLILILVLIHQIDARDIGEHGEIQRLMLGETGAFEHIDRGVEHRGDRAEAVDQILGNVVGIALRYGVVEEDLKHLMGLHMIKAALHQLLFHP